MAEPPGEGILDARHPSLGPEAPASPVPESHASTPTIAVGRPFNDNQTMKGRDSTQEEEDSSVVDTPRKSDSNSAFLEDQVHKLQVKLAELEKKSELETSERVNFQQTLDENQGSLHLSMTTEPSRRYLMMSRRMRRQMFVDEMDSSMSAGDYSEHPVGSFLSNAIDMLEMQLERFRMQEKTTRDLWDDRNRLQRMEEEWEAERKHLLSKQSELEMRGAMDREPPNEDSSMARQPVYEKPELNPVEWIGFKSILSRKNKDLFVIDILTGEPIISFERPTIKYGWKSRRRPMVIPEETVKPRKPVSKTRQQPIPGQAPLPERIRVNSKHILKVFEEIHGEAISTESSVVMIRPFKALAYYEESIRQHFQELEAKFGARSDVSVIADTLNEADGEADVDHQVNAADDHNQEGAESEDKGDQDEFTGSLTTYQHLRCLVDFMDGYMKEKLAYLASDRCQRVAFADIWHLFKPGDVVIEQSHQQAYRITSVTSPCHKVFSPWRILHTGEDQELEQTPIILNCVYVDFDGKALGPVTKKVNIATFDGEKAVRSFEVFPLRFAADRRGPGGQDGIDELIEPSLREKLIARGHMFLGMTTFKHMHYSGLTLDTREEVDSHVVVDFEEAFSANANPKLAWRPELENLIGVSTEKKTKEESCTADCCRDDHVHKDAYVDKKRNQDYMTAVVPEDRRQEPSPAIYPRLLQEINDQENPLSDDDLVIMSYRVFGFILRSRKWAQLDLTHLSLPETTSKDKERIDSTKEEEGEDGDLSASTAMKVDTGSSPEDAGDLEGNREFPKNEKAQTTCTFDQLESKESQQVDIVRGKGKGLIILLHGAPGVGKTTTAEGVAEMFKKPLFQITCGDLGTTASEVEAALETHFTLANRWGCVLLLDEADVFLATRSQNDFIRNGLVSVFLRVLEYYAGILFLTTNRVGDFDEAFASRIHISLYYPQLDFPSTKAIFELNLGLISERFMSKKRKIEIQKDGILQFAERYFNTHAQAKWNGRQIRNACQTALALAEFRAQGGSHERVEHANAVVKLTVKDLEVVSVAYLQFMHYLNELRGFDADMWAKKQSWRAREVDVLLKGEDGHQKTVPRPPTTAPYGPRPHPVQTGTAPAGLEPLPQPVTLTSPPQFPPQQVVPATNFTAPPPQQAYSTTYSAYPSQPAGYPSSSVPQSLQQQAQPLTLAAGQQQQATQQHYAPQQPYQPQQPYHPQQTYHPQHPYTLQPHVTQQQEPPQQQAAQRLPPGGQEAAYGMPPQAGPT